MRLCFMTKAEILKLIGSSGLPGEVKRYCSGIAGGGLNSSLNTALKKDAAAVIGNIDKLLDAGSSILALPKEELLFATGFNRKNISPERFEAALAEVRAAAFLNGEGFTGLKLIGPGMKRTADISGERAGKKYVFEVCCIQTTRDLSSVEYLIDNSGRLRKFGKGPVDYLELKYDKKVRQMNSSRKEYGCAGGGLIFVTESYGLPAPVKKPELEKLARGLYERKNRPHNISICILSGDIGCVFPEW